MSTPETGETPQPEHVYVPFTLDQVASLNAYQKSGVFHPFTGRNYMAPEGQDDVLIATADGWHSQYDPEYHQTWAWSWMADWSWKQINQFGRSDG